MTIEELINGGATITINITPTPEQLKKLCAEQSPQSLSTNRVLYRSITSRIFSTRTCNSLISAGIDTIEQLTQKTCNDLLKLRNFGHNSLSEVEVFLEKNNLSLRG